MPHISSSPSAIVSTDGSALSNPAGPMGWGWVDHNTGHHDEGGASNGTNQIGELTAILQVLRAYRKTAHIIIESDSQYAIQSSSTWLHNWKHNQWKNSKKQRISNYEIIRAIDNELTMRKNQGFTVEFKWVKGHVGDKFNEIADGFAHGYSTAISHGEVPPKLPIEAWKVLISGPYSKGLIVPENIQKEINKKQNNSSDILSHSFSHSSLGEENILF